LPEKTFAIYLGQNNEHLEVSFVMTESFFCTFEHPHGPEHLLREITGDIQKEAENIILENQEDLSVFCSNFLNKYKLNSIAAGYLNHDKIYTFVKNGLILLLREEKFYQAGTELQTLSGKYQDQDQYFFLTHSLTQEPHFNKILSSHKHLSPKEIVEHCRKSFNPDSPGGALIIQTKTPPSIGKPVNLPINQEANLRSIPLATKPKLTSFIPPLIANKYLRLAVLLLILGVVLTQVFFLIQGSLQKKQQVAYEKAYTQTANSIATLKSELNQNPSSAIKKIDPLLNIVSELKGKYPKEATKTASLEKQINDLKKTYGNATPAPATLFYDLALIDKKAEASVVGFSNNYTSVLDNKNKKAYLINLKNKDHQDFEFGEVKEGSLVTEYNQMLFLYSQSQGIYQGDNGKFKKIISVDKDWGRIKDFKIFNSNLYLLSQTTDEVYKFTPTQDGYSSKISYFQPGQSINLSSAQGLAIDFSVYILGENLWKYTAGSQVSFSPNTQLDYHHMRAIYKTSENNYLYLLDPINKRVVALNENGRLIKSIFNPKLSMATIIGVIKDEKIIFLNHNKIYEIDNF